MRIVRLVSRLLRLGASVASKPKHENGFRCESCGEQHGGLPRDLAYAHPIDWYAVRESERSDRIQTTDDLCIIDDEQYFIRGVLSLPVRDDGPDFGWGIWVRVAEEDFSRYEDAWEHNAEAQLPTFSGMITGPVGPYPDELVEVEVTAHPDGVRPTFKVLSDTHPLGRAQREGVTPEQAHDFVATVFK